MSFSKALTSPDPQALSLAALILLATYLTILCHTPPNPSPTARNVPDRAGSLFGPHFPFARRATLYALGVYHGIITLTYPSTPPALCSRPWYLNPRLFTWNPETVIYIAMILVAAPIRLTAFKQLGPNFTFQLATPGRLITTGLYGWVQHPSYMANFAVVFAHTMLCERRSGVVACWLPGWIIRNEAIGIALTTFSTIGVALACYVISIRVRDEEAMLRRTFGEEWEVYHKKTKRFIPHVF